MRKWLGMAVAGLVALACVATAQAEHYAVCSGLNQYKTSYVPSSNWLNGCVPDANNVSSNILQRGEWTSSTVTKLLNSNGTRANIRKAITNAAAKCASGDVFFYYHSSHGDTGCICTYDADYTADQMASDLAKFKSGVKVVVVIDACHSASMFKARGIKKSINFADFAAAVSAGIDAIRAEETARGIKSAKLSSSEIGWITAADSDQYSWDGDEGGAFTECFVGSATSGACDKSPYGNGDSYATFKEMFDYAVAQDETHGDGNPSSEDYTMPQCTNTTVLAAVTFGWVGKEAPTGVRFAPIPAQTATVGQALNYTVVATNSDGSSGKITYSVTSSTAPAGSYSVNATSGAFTFTPATDGTFTFNFVGTNTTAKTGGKADMTVTASLAEPTGLSNSGISASSFTANWGAVPGAVSYLVDVATDASFDRGGGGVLVEEGFDDGTKLAEGWTVESGALGGVYDSNGNFGDSSPSLKLSSTVTLSTPALSHPLDISFWYKGNGSAFTSTLVVEQLVGGSWSAVSEAEISGKAATYFHELDPAAAQVRFVFTKNSGNVALDDVKITGVAGDSTLVVDGASVSGTSYTAEALDTATYFWRVRAVGNAQGPYSATEEVTLNADPTAPPSIRAIDDIEIEVGETSTVAVKVSAPEEAPVTSLSITAGDAAAKLGEDGVFTFAPGTAGVYPFTITAVNANGSAEADFTVTATLSEPETPETPTVIGSDSFTAEWEPIPGAESYELVVIEGKGGSSGGGGGGGSGETKIETFAKASFAPGGSSYANQTISDGDLGTWTATQCRGDQGGVPTVGGTGTLTSPEIAEGVSAVEFDYSWPFTDTATGDIDLYVGGSKVSSASVTGGTAGTAAYSFSPISGATSIEFVNAYSTVKKLRISFNEIRITTASGKSIAKAVGDVVYSNNVGNVTSFDVTGLQPNTEYTFAFRAIAGEEATEWSEPVSVTTADGPAAPSWSTIPAQSAAVGYPFSIDLSAYVSGVPTPTLALTAGTAELSGTVLSFTPDALGEYTFTVTASNSSGDPADATFTVSAVDHVPTKYAVCVGINEYAEISGLEGCVNDSIYIENSLIERGGWAAENVTRLNDKNATKAAIRGAIAAVAAKAQAGDTFVYQHSSHGGQFNDTTGEIITNESGKATFLCVYDEDYDDNKTAYNDYEIAADMAAFNAGVKVAVIVDACHSGGLFKSKDEARAAAASFDLAGRVTAIMDADRARRKARGEDVAKALASSEIGWATACEYYETSYDGGFFHTDEWLTNPAYGDEYWVGDDENGYYNYPSSYKQGGVFTASSSWGWWNGTADADPEAGDNDGFCDVYEFWKKGYDFCSVIGEFWWNEPEYNYYPQCTNIAVLKSIELGWVVDPTVPANPQASEVAASSFVASWEPVDGAASYNLYVQQKVEADAGTSARADEEYLIDESFEGGEIPAGWTASSGVAIANGKGGDGTYCVAFKAAGATLVTPAVENPDGISFMYKRSSNQATWGLAIAVGPSADGPWTPVDSLDGAQTTWQTFSASIDADGAQYIQFTDARASGAAERYIDLVQVSGSSATWVDVEGYSPANVVGTSKEVTGLEMGTEYRFTVTSIDAEGVESAPSERVPVTTAEEDTKPVWRDIPEQSAVAGQLFTFKPADYVTASPAATITVTGSSLADGEYQFADGILTFTPAAEGTYTFDFQAANTLGVAEATLTVVAAGAPVYVPTLALSNPGSEGFDASWTACTGATSYQLQVATDDQFTTGGGGEGGAFTLVTSAAGFTAGEYVILADGTDTAMNSTYAGTSSKYLSCTDVTVTGNTVSTEEASIIWTLAGDASSCTLFNGDAGKYANPAASKTVGWSDTASGSWTLSVTEEGIVTAANADDTSWVLQYNSNNPRFMCYSSSQKKLRFFRRDAAKSVAKDGGSLVLDTTTPDLAYTVTGLEPETTYFARVRMAEGEWSAVESIKTQSDVPTPPAWLDLPAQTATVGLVFGLDLSSYVTGSPFPTITVDGTVAVDGNWSFTPDEAKTYTFELLATNTEGTAAATLTVVASPAPAVQYALCVGLSEYDMAAFEALGLEVTPLKGCVNDATYLKKNLSERGGWAEADIALLTNGAATKAAIRGAIAAAAAKAKAGDTFVYEHSSHGLQGDELDDYTAALATYENLYTDTELAEDLGAFADGVKVIVLIDACHSAGMIDDDDDDSDGGAGSASKARPAAAFDIARRVSALIDANRAVRKARGEDVSRTLTSDQIGWVTAAAYDETSKDGGYYDTDAWMSDDDAEGEERGGLFLASITWGWWSGKADVTGEGDGDGWFDAYEGWSFSTPFCAELDQTPQYLHEDVLRSVELGWVGDTAPSEAILFDPVPGVSVGIGEEAVLDGIVARNPDGTTDGITLSIVDPSPEEADYAFADGKLTFTPDEDGLFLFTVRAVKGRTSASKILGVTAILPAPVAQEVADADIAEDGFTARWLGVDAARNYQLQVSTDPDFSMGEPDELVNEGFDDVTNKVASLPDDWTFSGTFGIYATGGEAPPSIKLSTDGATLTTPPFKLTSAENGLAFWTKGNPSGTDMTSTLTVQQLVGEEWQTLKDGTFVPSTDGETKEFESLDKAATRIRFVMAKTAGNIAIDDVVVAQSQGGVEVDEDEIPASETSYAVEDLEPGTTYYFRVRALANSRSAWSETIEVTTAGEKPIPVPDLTALISETEPATSLVAFWLCPGAEEFRLQVATDEGFVSPVYDEELSESTQTVTGLTPETTYYVRVCGLVGERVGDWSNVESVTTAAGGKPDEIPIDETTFPTIGFKGGFSGSADTVFASGYSDVEAIYATWNGTEWQWVTDDETGELIVLPNEAPEGWPTVQISYPEGVNGALLRLRFIPKGN